MVRTLRALLLGAVLCVGAAAHAFSFDDAPADDVTDDAGADDLGDDLARAGSDLGATASDMAERPAAARASLPGCSMTGAPVAPIGSALVLAAWLLWALRPVRVRARRTARRRP